MRASSPAKNANVFVTLRGQQPRRECQHEDDNHGTAHVNCSSSRHACGVILCSQLAFGNDFHICGCQGVVPRSKKEQL